jgi:hypothetical protein
MTDEANSDTATEDLINQTPEPGAGEVETDKPVDTAATEDAAAADAGKKTDTLLSDDGGEGADDKSDVPEAYAFEPPEGFEVSEEVQSKLDAFSDTAKDMGLTQAQYQKLIEYDIQTGLQSQEAVAGQYIQRINGWADTVKADPELGGEKLQENLSVAKQAIEAFGSQELSALISAPSPENPDGLGLGNHPEFIRFMYRVGRSIGEDKVIEGDGRKVDDRNSLQRMYPTMFKEAG